MTDQPCLDVPAFEGLAKQWVVTKIDLAHRQVVRSAPVGVDSGEFFPAHNVLVNGAIDLARDLAEQ
jgi:hypothetical protein